jgi:Cys-tRNA synthase (O-phospho-L-seryl-tRNA:Cys-tRNA synthase)
MLVVTVLIGYKDIVEKLDRFDKEMKKTRK